VNERKPPSIELGSLDREFRRHGPQTASGELSDPALYEGILLRRSCAAILDYVIAFILSAALTLATCTASVMTLGLLSIPALLIGPVVLHAVLGGFMIGGKRAATWGMQAFGVRVVTQSGTNPDHVQAFLMVAMFFASTAIFFPILLMGLFMERSRLLHDLVAGTLVIRSHPR
jgi:uncharacterized RDD family membrane protein YckC